MADDIDVEALLEAPYKKGLQGWHPNPRRAFKSLLEATIRRSTPEEGPQQKMEIEDRHEVRRAAIAADLRARVGAAARIENVSGHDGGQSHVNMKGKNVAAEVPGGTGIRSATGIAITRDGREAGRGWQ